MPKLYSVVLYLAPTHRLIGTRVAKAASTKAVPPIGGVLENQPVSTGHVANVQSPALELAMVDEGWLKLSTKLGMESHRADAREDGQGTGWAGSLPGPYGNYNGPRGPQKACPSS